MALLPSDVSPHVHTRFVGRRLYYYPETDSTNDAAAAIARRGEPEGTVVYTDFQRRGRGRLDRAWSSPPGKDLLFSVILRPTGAPREVLAVTLAASVAVSVALAKAIDADVGVEWPNDLLVRGRKIAGILAESAADGDGARFVVVGVGINVNSTDDDFPEAVRARAASCRTVALAPRDRAALLGDVLTTLEGYYTRFATDGFASLVGAYEARLVFMGRRVRVAGAARDLTGVVAGVCTDGALRVAPDGGGAELAIYSETVEVVE